MNDIKLVALDVDGVIREASKLFYECHRSALAKEGFGAQFEKGFTVKQLWHFKGLGKFNDKREALRAIYILIKANRLGMLGKMIYLPDAGERISWLVESTKVRADMNVVDRMVKEYQRVAVSKKAKGFVRLYPSAKSNILSIKRSKKKLAILTNSHILTLERDLKELLGYFDYVVTPRDIGSPKPSGEGLRFISRKSGVGLADIAYVGDTVVDMITARDAGCISVAVYSGMGLKKHLEMESPDHIFKDLKEVAGWISKQ